MALVVSCGPCEFVWYMWLLWNPAMQLFWPIRRTIGTIHCNQTRPNAVFACNFVCLSPLDLQRHRLLPTVELLIRDIMHVNAEHHLRLACEDILGYIAQPSCTIRVMKIGIKGSHYMNIIRGIR